MEKELLYQILDNQKVMMDALIAGLTPADPKFRIIGELATSLQDTKALLQQVRGDHAGA
jgi:hypothetical protein